VKYKKAAIGDIETCLPSAVFSRLQLWRFSVNSAQESPKTVTSLSFRVDIGELSGGPRMILARL